MRNVLKFDRDDINALVTLKVDQIVENIDKMQKSEIKASLLNLKEIILRYQ